MANDRLKRARTRRLQGAPPDVYDCFDNGGQTFDRYSVLIAEHYARPAYYLVLSVSHEPADAHAAGGLWEFEDAARARDWRRRVARQRIAWSALPQAVRDHVRERLAAWEREFNAYMESCDA